TTRVVSSPIGRRPKAWRCPSASAASAAACSAAAVSRAGTYARTIDGRVGSIRAPSPSSTSSNAGSTLVPPGATRPRISETASTASISATTASSSQAPGPGAGPGPSPSTKGVAHLVEEAAAGRDVLAGLGGVLGQELTLALRQLRRDDHVHEDVEIALRAGPAEMRDAATAQPDLGPGLGPGLDLDLLVTVDGRDRDPRPEGRLGD